MNLVTKSKQRVSPPFFPHYFTRVMDLLRKALIQFIISSAALVVLFFLIRLPLMTSRNYRRNEGEHAPKRGIDSLLLSVMTQTTVGANNGVVAVSNGALWVEMLQALSTFAVVGVIVLVAIFHTSVDKTKM